MVSSTKAITSSRSASLLSMTTQRAGSAAATAR